MKNRIILCLLIWGINSASAQTNTVFPGLSAAQKQKILQTKIAVPLPTWIPAGFSVTNIVAKIYKSIKIENKILTITYGKKLVNNHVLQFKIDAGFDGLGDLPYEGGESIKSKIGDIWLYYEPFEEDMDGRKVKQSGFIQTEWFDVYDLAFHVVFIQSENESLNKKLPKISKADVKKILQSMQVLK
jgi:hypothetical protein